MRISRKCYESNFFHIMVQGIRKENIFKESINKEKYFNSLLKKVDEFDVKILAYCIMDNHAHILVHTSESSNLTKIMQSINTKFAKYYNKKNQNCGYVFRDRYRCENILTQTHLENCIRYIHNNPVSAQMCEKQADYEYSSYNDYMNKEGIITDDIIKLCFLDIKDYKIRLNYEVFENSFIDIENEFGEKNVEAFENVYNEIVTRECIKLNEINNYKIYEISKELLSRCNTTKKEIAAVLGIERTRLSRIFKKWEKE